VPRPIQRAPFAPEVRSGDDAGPVRSASLRTLTWKDGTPDVSA
jgi:hypothetical protein